MSRLTYITKDEIRRRIELHLCRADRQHPIGLHGDPRARHEVLDPETGRYYPNSHWFGVGPVNWAGQPIPALFDIRLPDTDRSYHAVNQLVQAACQDLGLQFINMA